MTIPTTPDRVFAVLKDGWAYASWVVGATHIRDVDAEWPAQGSRIHHSVGAWPVMVSDVSEVLALEPDRRLELKVKLWPLGEGRVIVELTPDGDRTLATMREEFTDGPTRFLPEPAIAPLLKARNKESLRRLADIAVHRES
jgi:uncharacterized protein YndB with AHSA1/START domain